MDYLREDHPTTINAVMIELDDTLIALDADRVVCFKDEAEPGSAVRSLGQIVGVATRQNGRIAQVQTSQGETQLDVGERYYLGQIARHDLRKVPKFIEGARQVGVAAVFLHQGRIALFLDPDCLSPPTEST